MSEPPSLKRRWLVPEVVQTSAMDCGPAVLAAVLQGFGIPANYGRLREACQTDVDGTSIDTLEAVAGQLGLDAEQVMLPADHLLLPEAAALPALLVVRQPNGFTHFVLAWRRHGPLVQVMDPGVGRRWVSARQLLDEVYVHEHRLPAEAWHAWALSDDFRRPLACRLRRLGLGRQAAALVDEAAAVPGWRSLARLDAAGRLVAALAKGGGIRRGREAGRVLGAFLAPRPERTIPDPYWSVRPAPPVPGRGEEVLLRGAVLVRIAGRSPRPSGEQEVPGPDLAAAVAGAAPRPARELFRLVRGGGLLSWVVLAVGLALAAGSVILEGLMLRGVLDLGRSLGLAEQRWLAAGCFVGIGLVLLVLELRLAGGLARLGRRLEVRLCAALLDKLPRLHDRYLQSRPTSDMAQRGHALHQVRLLPRLAAQLVRAALTLALTVAALAWIDPACLVPAAAAAGLALGLPLALLPLLQGLDLRVRAHTGALSRFYLDALLGLTAVRAHGAERAVRREHEGLLREWSRANFQLLTVVAALEAVQAQAGFGLAAWLVFEHAGRTAGAGGALLLAYWALNLPALGEEIGQLVRQYPLLRNTTLRLLEPLGAPEELVSDASQKRSTPTLLRSVANGGVDLRFEAVTVRAAGQTILADINLEVAAGSHVAVVGASGAGKSSLIGVLLGWHRAAAGRLLVDGEPLDAARLEQLRTETAWVDPAVQLWNDALAANLLYATSPADVAALGTVLGAADLHDVLRGLPDGLQTPLGEGGGLLSGGQGQRVRLGRALARPGARLVLLDEPFRGLDRAQRQALLHRARQVWRAATLLCVTHDVASTRDFERVLVLDGGRVVEDGCPADLAARPASRYRALLDAEEVCAGLWSGGPWRRLSMQEGHLREGRPEDGSPSSRGSPGGDEPRHSSRFESLFSRSGNGTNH